MDHPPMLDDEIIFCAAVLLVGVFVGCVSRVFFGKPKNKAAENHDAIA